MTLAKSEMGTFPVLTAKVWWMLRRRFKQTIPPVVSDSYLASVLEMQPESARKNVIPSLKQIGLIDQDGKPLPRAREWRDDETYKKICDEIRNEVYPVDLLSIAPSPAPDKALVRRWFANHTGVGESAAGKMASFYMVLAEADPTKAVEPREAAQRRQAPGRSTRRVKTRAATCEAETGRGAGSGQIPDAGTPAFIDSSPMPAVHINLQIHIASDASADQIEQIFASMAKHIYTRRA